MESAEQYATPVHASLGAFFSRTNDFQDAFQLRWGRIDFDVAFGAEANVKAILKVYREGGVCETFIVDTDAQDIQWNRHRRRTRDFFILPMSACLGPATCVKFSFIVHLHERSIPSQLEYIFMDRPQLEDASQHERGVTSQWATPSTHRTHELDAARLQRDVDWANTHFESLNLVPKFTRGQQHHPLHPKRYIHEQIDQVIRSKHADPARLCTIKVSVDCIDDVDFTSHLVHAKDHGVLVQCVVDWRKLTLTNSHNYERLKRSGIELLGVFCTPRHDLIEVDPDMHTKFIIFNDEDCILGSFNITFDRWWANWESGMTFRSKGVCRLLDNIFQSQRGGVNQAYRVDPASSFNLLYTFGRHHTWNGKPYLPHHAILAGIHGARRSIKVCLFLMGELLGEHQDSVVDALIQASRRGIDVEVLLNGHLARLGTVGLPRPMEEELGHPLLPAVHRLVYARLQVGLVYGRNDHTVPYSPIHSKFCVIDEAVVLDGSFNWYNTSVFSHDIVVAVNSRDVASLYLAEFEQVQREFRVYYYFPTT